MGKGWRVHSNTALYGNTKIATARWLVEASTSKIYLCRPKDAIALLCKLTVNLSLFAPKDTITFQTETF